MPGREISDRQNAEPKQKKNVCFQNGWARDLTVMWALKVPCSGPGVLHCLVSPTGPRVRVPEQWEVFGGADALGTLLGPFMELPGNAELSSRGGSSQTIYTSNIKQVCCPTARKPFEVQLLQDPYFAEYRSTFPCFSRSSLRGNSEGGWTQQPVQAPEVACGQREKRDWILGSLNQSCPPCLHPDLGGFSTSDDGSVSI